MCLIHHCPTFCSISWPNPCLVKSSVQSYWYVPITKHSRSKSPLRPPGSYYTSDILLNLPVFTKYWAKVSEGLSLCNLLSFNSHRIGVTSLSTSPLKLQFIYSTFIQRILKHLDNKASRHFLIHPPTLYLQTTYTKVSLQIVLTHFFFLW